MIFLRGPAFLLLSDNFFPWEFEGDRNGKLSYFLSLSQWFFFSILKRKGVFECLRSMGNDNKSTSVFLFFGSSLQRDSFLFSQNLVNERHWMAL